MPHSFLACNQHGAKIFVPTNQSVRYQMVTICKFCENFHSFLFPLCFSMRHLTQEETDFYATETKLAIEGGSLEKKARVWQFNEIDQL